MRITWGQDPGLHGGLGVITRFLIERRQESQSRRSDNRSRSQSDESPCAKKWRKPLETGKNKGMDSFLEPQK